MTTVKEILMQDAPASVETTYTLSVGGRFEGMIEDPSDADWIRVTLTAGRSYDIRLKGIEPDGVADTVLKLYNPVGEELAHNDDIDTDAREVDSILEFSPDATGVYYVSASGYPYPGEEETGSYVITVSDEADNNPDTLWTVSAGGRFNGTLDDKFDEDWIRVELVAGKTYGITLTGIGPDVDTDTILRIYNPAGDQVAFHDDVDYAAGKVNSRLTFSPAATGVYYISAGAYGGNPTRDYSGRYQVTVFDEADRDGLTLTGMAGDDAYFRALVGGPGDDALDGKAGSQWFRPRRHPGRRSQG